MWRRFVTSLADCQTWWRIEPTWKGEPSHCDFTYTCQILSNEMKAVDGQNKRKILSRMSSTLRSVLVYNGEGAKDESVERMLGKLSKCLMPNTYHIRTISPEETIKGEWRSTTDLYIIGGGYDLGFIRALGDEGTIQIRDFVRSGGRYMGVCAGAYFACDSIEFDKDGPQEVCGERILKFFPGVCIGPVHGPYNYNLRISARAIPVQFSDPDFSTSQMVNLHCYFNGGGMFLPQDKYNQCRIKKVPENYDFDLGEDVNESILQEVKDRYVLAVNMENKTKAVESSGDKPLGTGTIKDILSYFCEVEGQPIAAVTCEVGKGLAVLSSVHLEYDAKNLDKDDKFLEPVIKQLKPFHEIGEKCFKSLLKHAGLDTQPNSPTSTRENASS